jgi:hypothetical protein
VSRRPQCGANARGHVANDDVGDGAPFVETASYNGVVRGIEGLPGADLIGEGLRDLTAGVESVPAMLVAIGAPRLRRLGIAVPHVAGRPEHRLYALLLGQHGPAAHGRYNALLRRLVSFERALECVG